MRPPMTESYFTTRFGNRWIIWITGSIFSKPVCLNYKDHTFTDFNSWASLYAKVAFLLKQDYPQIIVDGGSLSEGAAPEFSMNSKALRKPKAITDGLFIETNHSATEIASRIATLLRLCGVDLNKVSITYTLKKEAEQKRTSQARSENEKLYEKLYSISRIYDDRSISLFAIASAIA